MKRRALFIVSGDGLGHIVRCNALAGELHLRGWTSETMKRSAVSVAVFGRFDVAIIDGVGLDDDALSWLRTPTRRVAIVDTMTAPDFADLVVCGNAGARAYGSMGDHAIILAGPQYALIREEFQSARKARLVGLPYAALDLRGVEHLTAFQIAGLLRKVKTIVTYGGMRALEAACVRGSSAGLIIEARNPGEELNKAGLEADRSADLIDGRGRVRVADAIEEFVNR